MSNNILSNRRFRSCMSQEQRAFALRFEPARCRYHRTQLNRDKASAKARQLCGFAISFGLGCVIAACTAVYKDGGPPTVVYNTPFGSSQVYPGGPPQVPAGGPLAAPPANLGGNPPPPPTPRSLDGVYSGVAVPLDTAGGLCIQNQQIRGFRVHGNSVRWGPFHGRIERNGVQMVNRNTWITGQFEEGQFSGQISMSGPMGAPGCTFMMTLTNTGA